MTNPEQKPPILREVPRAEVTDANVLEYYNRLFGDRDPVKERGTSTGTPGDWWPTFALTPDIFKHATDGFKLYRNPDRKLDPVLRELGQTRAGWAKGSQFVFSQHCKSLRGLGVAEAKIKAIAYWAVADCYDEQERAVLAYTDALMLGDGRVPLEVFDKLKTFMDDVEIMEFTYITCLYGMHAVMTRALRLEYDAREDPIVEIAAPEGFSAADFLGGSKKPQKKD
jgi:alkylhydroperoxidase family enzyme